MQDNFFFGAYLDALVDRYDGDRLVSEYFESIRMSLQRNRPIGGDCLYASRMREQIGGIGGDAGDRVPGRKMEIGVCSPMQVLPRKQYG